MIAVISSGLKKRRKHCETEALYCRVVVRGAMAMGERRDIVVYMAHSEGYCPSAAERPGG